MIKNTSNISRVFNGQVISGVRLKGHSFETISRSKRWKFFFRVDGRSKSSSYSYVTSAFSEILASSGASRPSFASEVNAAVAKADDLESSQDVEDDDNWLTVSTENFDSILQEKMRPNDAPSTSRDIDVDHSPDSVNGEDGITKAKVAKLRDLASKVDAFVTGEGDVEGAMFEE